MGGWLDGKLGGELQKITLCNKYQFDNANGFLTNFNTYIC